MVVFEVVLTVAVVVLVVGGAAAVVTRPVWTALWKRYQLEKAVEERRQALTAEQRREREAALHELDAVLHAADADPETAGRENQEVANETPGAGSGRLEAGSGHGAVSNGVLHTSLPGSECLPPASLAGAEKDRLQKVGLCDREE